MLRFDDRGVGKSTGDFATATTEEFEKDALAVVSYLKGRAEIAGDRIGMLGHSEGGLIAPMATTQSKDVAFVVMLAGPGVPGEYFGIEETMNPAALNAISEWIGRRFVEK